MECMPSARIQYLIDQYFKGTCTPAERNELAVWVSQAPDGQLREALGDAWEQHVPVITMPPEMEERILQQVFTAPSSGEVTDYTREISLHNDTRYRWWAVAAAGLLLLTAAWWWGTDRPAAAPVAETRQQRFKNEVAPGGNKAMLILADGSAIALDSAANGVLSSQGGSQVVKLGNGQLAYRPAGAHNGRVLYNTVRTPRGGTYRLTLPDGTGVWLNAGSSVTYPTAFTGNARPVAVTGEAYFEVTKDAARPFQVTAADMNITVLGTSFNVNAYTDNATRSTTLLEGAVKVTSGASNHTLKPGQQARLNKTRNTTVISQVDTEEIVAWKNGYFQFTDAGMEEVMQQLEQWYDVKVTYEGAIPQRSFGGGIQRSLPLTKVLSILEENDVKFRIEGRNITVMK